MSFDCHEGQFRINSNKKLIETLLNYSLSKMNIPHYFKANIGKKNFRVCISFDMIMSFIECIHEVKHIFS